jgi:UDP-glucose 4-epimerase
MVVPRLVRQAVAGEDLTVYGDGSQTRCFLHVADAVSAIIRLSEHEAATGRAFNIGNPEPTTILELAGRVIARARSSSRIRFVPYDEAYGDGFEELGRRQPDTSALEELLDWRPRRTLEEALDDVIAFQRAELALEETAVEAL